MKIPPEIVFRGIERTPSLKLLITREIAKLEKVCDYIISSRIAVEQSQNRHKSGNANRVRIDIRIPDHREIKVERYSNASRRTPDRLAQIQTQAALEDQSESNGIRLTSRSSGRRRDFGEKALPELIRKTFESARREVQKVVEKQAGKIKTNAQQQEVAIVEKIFREKNYGFLRTLDGQEVYFHKNSVLHNHWEYMTVGTVARYTLALGEKGLQASTVEPVEKAGVAETHDSLHDLSSLSLS